MGHRLVLWWHHLVPLVGLRSTEGWTVVVTLRHGGHCRSDGATASNFLRRGNNDSAGGLLRMLRNVRFEILH